MKNKIVKVILLTTTMATVLTGCGFSDKLGGLFNKNKDVAVEDQMPDIPASSYDVEFRVGDIIDSDLINKVTLAFGIGELSEFLITTEYETNVTYFEAVEGIHTVELSYTTLDGVSDVLSFSYNGITMGDEEEVEDTAEAEIPEVKIQLRGSVAAQKVTSDATDSWEAETVYEITDADNIELMATKISEAKLPESNKYIRRNDGSIEYQFDDPNYTTDVLAEVYAIDSDYFVKTYLVKYTSVDAAEEVNFVYMPYINNDEATEEQAEDANSNEEEQEAGGETADGTVEPMDTETQTDYGNTWYSINEATNLLQYIEDNKYLEIVWMYDAEIVNEDGAEITDLSEEERQDILETALVPNYAKLHPELYIWPELDVEYSRWDWRITDGTQINGTITLDNGSVIPVEQANEGGYAYDFSSTIGNDNASGNGSGYGTKPNSNNNNQNVDSTTIYAGNKTFEVYANPAKFMTLNTAKSTDKIAYVSSMTDTYVIASIDKVTWQNYKASNYYASQMNIGTEYSISETNSGTLTDGTLYHIYSISYRDSAGQNITKPYMGMIDCGDNSYLVVYNDKSLEDTYSTGIEDAIKNCIMKK